MGININRGRSIISNTLPVVGKQNCKEDRSKSKMNKEDKKIIMEQVRKLKHLSKEFKYNMLFAYLLGLFLGIFISIITIIKWQ